MHDANDETAAEFVALLTGCQAKLTLYVRSLMPGDRGAEEVVQQANSKIWQKRNDFQLGTNFPAWAMAIARYEVLNYRKQQARDARLQFSDELEQTITEELQEWNDDQVDRHAALQNCLKKLKPESRELLMTRYASAETLADLSQRIGRSVGGIKVTLSRLRSKLSDCIERHLRTEGGLP